MSFERMRMSFKSFLGLNASPQINYSSQASITIPQDLQSSNSQCNLKNKFVQIEKKQERLNPYKKSLLRLNDYQKTVVKGTDCSKCPTIQYQINKDEKPAIDHKINNPRWKREDQSQDHSSYSQRWSSQNDASNPTFFKVQSKPLKNQTYDTQTLSQSKASINFQKKQFLQYLEDKPITVIRNDYAPFEEKKKKSSQISIRRTESVIFDVQDEPPFENGRKTVQKSENTIKPNEEEGNQSASESIIIKKQPTTRFNKLKKQEFEYNPKTPTNEAKPISPSYEQQQPNQQIQQVKQQENITRNLDEQIQQVQQKQQSSAPIEQIQQPLQEVKQEPIIQQKIDPQPQTQTLPPAIEINPFTSNIESTLFNAPWITNQPPQDQSTFNLFQQQPMQTQFQTPFVAQQQQPVFPFQNEPQIQQQVFSNQTFFSQQVQASSNPFTSNQFSQNVFNLGNTQQSQSVYQTFQQNQTNTNDLFGLNQQKQQHNNNNNNNNTFLFQTNSLGGGSFSADDQNKPRTIDLFSAQPVQNSQTSMMTSHSAVNLFTLDQNNSAQPQTYKESDRYKNKFKQNTVKYNAAQRMQ
ncbi:unnamed protein product [Paramecium octaurelia]|uniref:Uncharacterized protein n=1 Tax=Paramecium octaurelia TaxID=43137 RepID=A0A8S1WYV9_PAROT|nr:unnamed protein product [Paramecium octaurelia]